ELLRERHPDDADVLFALGRCHVYRSQLDQARERFNQLLAKHPRHYDGLVARGRLEFRGGDSSQAENFLRRAVDVNADLLDAWQTLEANCVAEGDEKQAAACRMEIDRIERAMGRQQRLMIQAVEEGALDLNRFGELGDGWRALHNPREAQRWYFC